MQNGYEGVFTIYYNKKIKVIEQSKVIFGDRFWIYQIKLTPFDNSR